jgi:hypothetical protein
MWDSFKGILLDIFAPYLGIFTELDDGNIYRKPLYLMVKLMVSG